MGTTGRIWNRSGESIGTRCILALARVVTAGEGEGGCHPAWLKKRSDTPAVAMGLDMPKSALKVVPEAVSPT